MTHEQWLNKAVRLYGEDPLKWKFKCPVCETVQTGQDFIDQGATKDDVRTSIAVECVGRWMPEKQKAFDNRTGKIKKGEPCNYAGYGLLKLNPVAVEFEDGKIFHAFDFADEEPDAS